MPVKRVIAFIVSLSIFISACSSGSSVVDIPEIDSPASLLNFSDKYSVGFEEGVTQREKEVVNFTIELIKQEFKRIGIEFTSNVYIASTRETYFEKQMDLLVGKYNQDLSKLEKQYSEKLKEYSDGRKGLPSKGTTYSITGDIFINLDLIRLIRTEKGILYKNKRDISLSYVLIHEAYHVVQARLSLGWPDNFMREISANVFAEKLLMESQCMYYPNLQELNFSITRCDYDSVKDGLLALYKARYFKNEYIVRAFIVYAIEEYGTDILNVYYSNLGHCANENFLGKINSMRDSMEASAEYSKEYWDNCFTEVIEKIFDMTVDEFSRVVDEYAESLKQK